MHALCMHVYLCKKMCTYLLMHTHAPVHVHKYIYVHIFTHPGNHCTYTHECATHPCKYMHAHTSIYTYTYIHTCIFTYVHIHACTFTFMYTYTHAHTRPFHACLIPYLNLWTVFYFWCYESSFLCPTFHPRNELSSCEVHLTTCGFLLSNKTH